MASIIDTQSQAMTLINCIQARKKAELESILAPNMSFFSAVNQRTQLLLKGRQAYLNRIEEVWNRTIGIEYCTIRYHPFNNDKGSLVYIQITLVNINGVQEAVYSEGKQTFSFKDNQIKEITVAEKSKVLTKEEHSQLIAKVNAQKPKADQEDLLTGNWVIL